MNDADAIVIGGGHAGIEAALALSRLGWKTLLITQNLDCIGKMSCNPAIGGISKGNIVREIDALGGEMGRLIDKSLIQFRMLNRSRGPAVQAPRAQADKHFYSQLAKQTLELQPGLELFQDTVTDLEVDPGTGSIVGVVTERGRKIRARAVVLTTGTFMEGRIFIGEYRAVSGRLGEPAAVGLGPNLRKLGITVGRMKTGTPARVLGSSLDFSRMEEQPGEERAIPFSFGNDEIDRPLVSCWITYTNEKTHEIIRANTHRSPLFSGQITGLGPRYCPSIEDKVKRFAERDRHQIFVEPEGMGTDEMYLNGISSSLPEEVQEAFLRTLPGFENCVIMRPGYAVEYDYIDPLQLFPSLEMKKIPGLFVAGQTNGTSGYEEAAGQGLMAGINAAKRLSGEPPVILSRSEAYIGVLIDDLTTMGTKEPYRMFTSRAEYRLNLRHDAADMRLYPKALEAGLLSDRARERLELKKSGMGSIVEILQSRKVKPDDALVAPELQPHVTKSFALAVKDPTVSIPTVEKLIPELVSFRTEWKEQVELDIKYEGYIKRQEQQISRFARMEGMKLAPDFDYDSIEGLSNESREKLKQIQPVSLGQASRISGVSPADIAVLVIALGRNT